MRIPGLGGQVISKLGGTTVTLPGGQIYENLVSGSIDATEWVGPYNDYFMKFCEQRNFTIPGACMNQVAVFRLLSMPAYGVV